MRKIYSYFVKTPILIFILIILLPLAINLIVSIKNPILNIKGDTATWISFFGNYFGAVIGGLTALVISRLENNESRLLLENQIQEQRDKEIRKEKIAQYYSLTLLNQTLNSYKSALELIKTVYNSDTTEDSFSLVIKNEAIQFLNNNWSNIESIATPFDRKIHDELLARGFLNKNNSYKLVDYAKLYKQLDAELPFILVNFGFPVVTKWHLYEKLSEVTSLVLKNKLLLIINKLMAYNEAYDSSFDSKRNRVASKEVDFKRIMTKPQKNKKDMEFINEFQMQQLEFTAIVLNRSFIVKEILFETSISEVDKIIEAINYELKYTDDFIMTQKE